MAEQRVPALKHLPAAAIMPNAGNGFRQVMLKTALETIPQLMEENHSIWMLR
ncbi:hypothetical protein VP01_4584g1 [Puccinia sorghi]|uniref:Uncharacterized protein n=1 Tax=Puccinia sorghi TaxID=27349 RepID=A0A0L6UPD9_9BASI|nr:hypothetical protein VP01_4584g1 [Puccinia sorghi]